jgi:hypothetical protein
MRLPAVRPMSLPAMVRVPEGNGYDSQPCRTKPYPANFIAMVQAWEARNLGETVLATLLRLTQVERIDTDRRIKAAQLLISDHDPLPRPMSGEFGRADRHVATLLCDLFEPACEVGCGTNNSEIQTVGAANVSIRYRTEMKRGDKG